MNTAQMRITLHRLAAEYKSYANAYPSDYWMSRKETLKDKKFLEYHARFYHLMQFSSFFEVLFEENCVKTKTTWTFLFSHLLNNLHDVSLLLTPERISRFKVDSALSCEEYAPYSGTELDTFLSEKLAQSTPSGEQFLGVIFVDIRFRPEIFEEWIQKLQSTSSPRASFIVYICDGGHVESLYFTKDESKKLHVLTATLPNGCITSVHALTKYLVNKYKIDLSPCPGIKMVAGNCAIHAELNINAVLCEAVYRNNSVYTVIDALKKQQLHLDHYQIHFNHIAPNSQSLHKPDAFTLARLLSKVAKASLYVGAKGWFDFCKKHKMHPEYVIKTSYSAWDSLQYPWSVGKKYLCEVNEFQNVDAYDSQNSPMENQELEPAASDTISLSNIDMNALQKKIKVMKKYGERIGTDKGIMVQQLARDLKEKLDAFCNQIDKNPSPLNTSTLTQFKDEFTQLAHSKDSELSVHRAIWKPIVANIIIALTGIGFLALLGHIIFRAAQQSTNKNHTVNNLLFFARTESETLIEDLEVVTHRLK